MKRRAIPVLMILLAAVLVLAGCGETKTTLMADSGADNTAVIVAEDAEEGDSVTTGPITVEEGEIVAITSSLEGDAVINIKLIPATEAGADATPEELMESVDPANAVLDLDGSGSGLAQSGVGTGDFMVMATVVNPGSGSVEVRVERPGGPAWKEAATAEEAAEGAGLGSFKVPDGVETTMGTVVPLSYSYIDGVADADISVDNVDLHFRKGLASEYDDVSFEKTIYFHDWTREVGGTPVKCYGNRDGEATKTVWTDGKYVYALLVNGAGEDEDYGLLVPDVEALVDAVK